jgi:hypothetical protein
MPADKRMIEYANDCMRLAGKATDPLIRDELMKLALHWNQVAHECNAQKTARQRRPNRPVVGRANKPCRKRPPV